MPPNARSPRQSLVALRYTLCAWLMCVASAVFAEPTPQVIVFPAQKEQLVTRVEALGTLRANESVAITASVTETVTRIGFDDGDRVSEGQVLAEMTSSEEHALLEEATSTMEEAYNQYQRVKSLVDKGTASRSLVDERRRQWETARARLAAIESRLADRLIKAPFAGVVGLRNLSLGALVEPGDQITTLDDDSVMKLEFPVPSVYLTTLYPGLAIIATAPAFADRSFEGTVKAVNSRVDPVTRSILVRAVLPNPDRILRPGLLMRVDLLMSPREAVVIPEEALQSLGEQQVVLVVDPERENRVERRRVRTGLRLPGEVEIKEGLIAGEWVITHGALKARPGQPVAISAKDDGSLTLPAMLKSVVPVGAPE